MKLFPALAVAFAAAASVSHAAPSGLELTRGWSRPAAAGTNGVGYLTIANHSARADAVVALASPAAKSVDMHLMAMSGEVMSMASVTQVPAPAGGAAQFAPGGYHMMLIGLTHALKVGDHIPLTVTFASGAKLKTTLTVALQKPAS